MRENERDGGKGKQRVQMTFQGDRDWNTEAAPAADERYQNRLPLLQNNGMDVVKLDVGLTA